MVQTDQDKLNFFVPIDSIEKSTDENGKEVLKVKGIASAAVEDSDKETLEPKGFQLDPFLKSGFINYNHKSNVDPAAIIGEPTKAFIKDNLMHVEGILYPENPIAKSVYNMAKVLEKNSKTRRFGYSIEGSVIERNPENEKHITKAAITGLAITPTPKNPRTLLEVVKGEVDAFSDDSYEYDTEEYKGGEIILKAESDSGIIGVVDNDFNISFNVDIEKAMQAGSVTGTETTGQRMTQEPLKEESIEGKKTKKVKDNTNNPEKKSSVMTKGEIYMEIFGKFTKDTEIAKSIYGLAEKISDMADNKNITTEDLEKAHNILDLAKSASEGGDAGEGEASTPNLDELQKAADDAAEALRKAKDAAEPAPTKKQPGEGTAAPGTAEKDQGEEDVDGGTTSGGAPSQKGVDPELIKAFEENMNKKFAAIATIMKAQSEENEELRKSVEDKDNLIKSIGQRLNLVEKQKPARKAVATTGYIKKGEDNQELEGGARGGRTLSQSINKGELVDILYSAGVNEEGEVINKAYADAASTLEISGMIGGTEQEIALIQKGLQKDFGIEVVK